MPRSLTATFVAMASLDTVAKVVIGALAFANRSEFLRPSKIYLGMWLLALLALGSVCGLLFRRRDWTLMYGIGQLFLLLPIIGGAIGASVAGETPRGSFVAGMVLWQITTGVLAIAAACRPRAPEDL